MYLPRFYLAVVSYPTPETGNESIDQMQRDLDAYIAAYNHKGPH